MPTNDIFLDGTGKFQQSTENAGVIKFGEFSQTSINTGNIAISALFTGSAVNSGTIGNYLPYDTAVIVQSYSADWNTAYQFAANGGGGAIEITTADITDYTSTTTNLITSLAPVTSVAGRTGAVVITTADLTDFNTAADARITAAAGTSIATLVGGTIPSSQLPSYVDDVKEFNNQASFPATGTTDVIYVDVDTKKIYRWSGTTYIEISPSPGTTDAVVEGSTNLYFTSARAASAAPVQSVAGKTGVVTLSTSDITGLQAAVEAFAPAQSITSVAGKTGVVTLSTSDIGGLAAALAAASNVTSVAGRSGEVTLSASDIVGFAAATDARITAQSGASLDSPAFTGTPTAPTAAAGTSNSQIANTAFVINNSGDKYRTSSTSSLTIDNSNGKTMSVGTGLSYTSQQDITVSYNADNHMHGKVVSYDTSTGTLVFDVNSHTGSGTYTQWVVNVGGITAGGGGDVTSVAGKTGVVVLSTADITNFTASTNVLINDRLTSLNANSAAWQQAYTNVNVNSAAWQQAYTRVNTASASWTTNVNVASAAWQQAYTNVNANSAAWQQVYSRVNTASASWTTNVNVASAAWQQAYTNVNYNSAAWTNTITSVAGRTGAVVITTADLANFNTATDARISAAAGTSVATLVNGTVPASQLPSYVDDVMEYSALASFPSTGETGKIYVDTTTKKIYRWSGSAYVEIAASPGSTDSVTEGSTNLYFTNARADGRLTALNANSGSWQQAYTNVNTNSASWTSTNFGSVSATAVSLSNATLSSYSTPVTASGDFVVITVGNQQRLIRLWDFK